MKSKLTKNNKKRVKEQKRVYKNILLKKINKNTKDYTKQIYDYLDLILKKRDNKNIYLSEDEKNKIYENLYDFFIPPNKYFKNANEIIYDKEIKNLIPISKLLTSSDLNNLNIEYIKNYETKGSRGIIKTNPLEKNKINKIMRLKIRFDEKNINKNMDLTRLYLGKIFAPFKTDKYYTRIYKRLLYNQDNNYVPGNIIVENLVHYVLYITNKNIIPKLDNLIFYKKVCKIKMEKARGLELSKILNIDNDFYEIKNKQSILKNQIFIESFSKFMVYLQKELKELQDKINFVHGDLHIDNLIINLNSIHLMNRDIDLKHLIKILDFEYSSFILPLINKKTNKKELKYIKNYEDNESFFWVNKYLNPVLNPYLLKITDNIKLITTILITNKYNYVLKNVENYKVNPIIENLIISKLGIEQNYKQRLEDCLEFFIKFLRKKNMEPFNYINNKKIKKFKYYHQYLYVYLNYNYQFRNYIFFNKILIKPSVYKIFGDYEKITYEEFEKIIEENHKNFIQPSFAKEPLGYRFTCEYLIKIFSEQI